MDKLIFSNVLVAYLKGRKRLNEKDHLYFSDEREHVHDYFVKLVAWG